MSIPTTSFAKLDLRNADDYTQVEDRSFKTVQLNAVLIDYWLSVLQSQITNLATQVALLGGSSGSTIDAGTF